MAVARRWVGLLLGVVLTAPLAGCGAKPPLAPVAPATPTPGPSSTAVIPPAAYPDSYRALTEVALATGPLAGGLAAAVVEGARVRGVLDSPAAALRSDLTARLTIHVQLAGLLARNVLDSGPDSEPTAGAFAALADNGTALGALIPAGPARATPAPTDSPIPTPSAVVDAEAAAAAAARTSPDFDTAWQVHLRDLAAYALATREGIEADKRSIRRDLFVWRTALAGSLKQAAKGQVRSTALRGQLGRYLSGMTRAIDGLGAGNGAGPEQLRVASRSLGGFAEALGQGLARVRRLDDDARNPAARIRADFTRLLVEHVGMVAAVVRTGYPTRRNGGLAGPAAVTAKLGLDANSKDLAKRLSPAGDARAQAQFVAEWRTLVNHLLEHAAAVAAGASAGIDAAVAVLDADRAGVAKVIAGATGRAPKPFADQLRGHIARVTGLTLAIAAGARRPRS